MLQLDVAQDLIKQTRQRQTNCKNELPRNDTAHRRRRSRRWNWNWSWNRSWCWCRSCWVERAGTGHDQNGRFLVIHIYLGGWIPLLTHVICDDIRCNRPWNPVLPKPLSRELWVSRSVVLSDCLWLVYVFLSPDVFVAGSCDLDADISPPPWRCVDVI